MHKIIKKENSFLIELSKEIYTKEAILATSYRFTNRCYICIDMPSQDNFTVSFKNKENEEENIEQLIADFCNELIDQQLRVDVEKEYGEIRNTIVKKALSPIED